MAHVFDKMAKMSCVKGKKIILLIEPKLVQKQSFSSVAIPKNKKKAKRKQLIEFKN